MLSRVSVSRIDEGSPQRSGWFGERVIRSVAAVPDSDKFVDRDEYLARLGVVLQLARKAAGYTQEEMGDWMQVDPSAFTRWEAGRNALSAYDLARLIHRYGFDADLAFNPPTSKVEIRRRLGPVAAAARAGVRAGLLRPLPPIGDELG